MPTMPSTNLGKITDVAGTTPVPSAWIVSGEVAPVLVNVILAARAPATRGWNWMRTFVFAPDDREIGPAEEIMANAEVSLETMLLIVIELLVVLTASRVSVLLDCTATFPDARKEGSIARPVVRYLMSEPLITRAVVPPFGFTVCTPLGHRPSVSVAETTTALVASARRSTRRTPSGSRFGSTMPNAPR